jgi:hypothetical protein
MYRDWCGYVALIVCIFVCASGGGTSEIKYSSARSLHRRTGEANTPILTPIVTEKPVDPIDPYNYSCTRVERLSGRCRWCNRDYPTTEGVWAGFPPFWQQPGPCQNQAFDVEDTRKCLTGRTIYAIGNSVGRQAPFNLVEMLGGDLVKREDQRDQCPKHETTWDDSCHSEIAGVKLKYLFLQFPDGMRYSDRNGFPFFRYRSGNGARDDWHTGRLVCKNETTLDGVHIVEYCDNAHDLNADLNADHATPLWMDDNCINHNTRECLARFFHGSTERDILIFTLGMTFAMDFDGREPSKSPGVDYKAWMLSQAAAFKGHLAATFKGQVFRVTHGEFNSNSYLLPKTPNLKRTNDLLWEVWQPDSSELPWYTIDQWPINQNRHSLYNDHVHFNGPLTHAMLHQVLNELCPGGGKTTWLYPEPGMNVTQMFAKTHPPTLMKVQMTRFNNWYMVLLNGTRHNVPDMDTLAGLEYPERNIHLVTMNDVNMFPEGEPLVPCDPAWTSQLCKASIYYKALHGMSY